MARSIRLFIVLFVIAVAAGFYGQPLFFRKSVPSVLPDAKRAFSQSSRRVNDATSVKNRDVPPATLPRSSDLQRDYVALMEDLLRQREHTDPLLWREKRDQIYASMRTDVSPEAQSARARWEDSGAGFRRSFYRLGQTSGQGVFRTTEFNKLPNKETASLLLAGINLTGNWTTTAEAFERLPIDATVHAQVLDIFVESWLEKAPPAMAVSWLGAHAGDPKYDRARLTASVHSGEAGSVLSTQMSDSKTARLAQLMTEAYAH